MSLNIDFESGFPKIEINRKYVSCNGTGDLTYALGLKYLRGFEEIYDAEKFITSMSGVIQVEKRKSETSTQKLVSVKVPYNAKRDYITTNIEPQFQTTRNLRVITYFPSLTMKEGKVDKDMNPYSCWVAFEALRLKPELQEVVDSISKRLRSHDPHNQFVAIDFKSEMLGTSACRSNANKGMKNCYNPVEIAQFFQRIGYPRDTTIYVTQLKPDRILNELKDVYPKTFTKVHLCFSHDFLCKILTGFL